MPRAEGVWVAYYRDRSGIYIFASEIRALRVAVEKHMEVKFVQFGSDPFDGDIAEEVDTDE